jgi:hypothetical protein
MFVAGLAALSAPALAADSWAEVVDEAATREEVVAALGKPEIEFTAFVPKGEQPLQISPSLPAPPEPGAELDLSGDDLLRVLEYRGLKRGLNWQVVLKDDKVWYCVAPPLADETGLDALAKKFGKAPIQSIDVLTADTLRTWDLIRYPKKKRIFVREPGGSPVLARIITR